jgi:hypothetical protein
VGRRYTMMRAIVSSFPLFLGGAKDFSQAAEIDEI